jgi:hypothetical protein
MHSRSTSAGLHHFSDCHHDPFGVVDKPEGCIDLFLEFSYPGLFLEKGYVAYSPISDGHFVAVVVK